MSDGTTILGTAAAATDENYFPKILAASYTGGGPGTIYIYGDNNFGIYKIEVTGPGAAVLGVNDFNSPVTTNLKSIGNRIYVSNVSTNTEIDIYSLTGALLKTFKTNTDTDFSFKTGLWIATVKTDEGQKVVKLVVK